MRSWLVGAVTGGAVDRANVIKADVIPPVYVVTERTVPAVMVGR